MIDRQNPLKISRSITTFPTVIAFKVDWSPNSFENLNRSITTFPTILAFKWTDLPIPSKIWTDRSQVLWNCLENKSIDRKNSFEIFGPIASLKEIVQKVYVMLSMVNVIVIMSMMSCHNPYPHSCPCQTHFYLLLFFGFLRFHFFHLHHLIRHPNCNVFLFSHFFDFFVRLSLSPILFGF